MRGARALLWVSLFAAGLLAATAANEAQTHTVHSLKNWPLRLPGSLLEKAGGARRRVSVSNSTASDGLRDQDKGKKGRKHETEPPLTDEIRAKLTDKKYCKTLPYCTGDHQECRFSNTSFGPAFRKRSVLDALRFFVKTKYYDPKQFFAYGGTLIGIKRDGKFILWDKDGDLGVTWTHWKRVMSQTGGKNVKYGPQGRFLLSMQCRLMDIQGRLIDSKTGYYVDIFTFFNSDNWKEVTDPEVNKQIPKDYSIGKDELFNPFPWPKESLKCRMFPKSALFPLKPCKFEGIELACPADSEKVLSACYEDWRVPSPPESWKGPVPPANSTMIAKF